MGKDCDPSTRTDRAEIFSKIKENIKKVVWFIKSIEMLLLKYDNSFSVTLGVAGAQSHSKLLVHIDPNPNCQYLCFDEVEM